VLKVGISETTLPVKAADVGGARRPLADERVPLDNDGSESALRRVALRRKNCFFVHDVERGESIAGLHALVATCGARRINPFEYLADVLIRVQEHPARSIDERSPGAWAADRDDAWAPCLSIGNEQADANVVLWERLVSASPRGTLRGDR
jgi:hypothetical protein